MAKRTKKAQAIMTKYKPRKSKTSVSSKIVIPEEHERLTEKQHAAAISEHEMPPCIGVPDVPCTQPPTPVMISGYDDKLRCLACNKVHVALVEEEAGNDSDPNTPPQFVSPRLNAAAISAEAQRTKSIMERCKPRDGWTTPPQISAAPGDLVDMKGRRFAADGSVTEPEPVKVMTGDERRAAILKKYRQRQQ